MNTLTENLNRVLKIKWFSTVGKPIQDNSLCFEPSIEKVSDLLASPEWENVTLEESNKISGYLAIKHSVIFQNWNNLAKESKVFFDKEIKKSIPTINGINTDLLLQCIQWDVTHYLIESYYCHVLATPLFFEKLLSIYESGHLPCGWKGHWPDGEIIIY